MTGLVRFELMHLYTDPNQKIMNRLRIESASSAAYLNVLGQTLEQGLADSLKNLKGIRSSFTAKMLRKQSTLH